MLLFSLNFFLFSQKARIDILTVLEYHWNFPFTAVVLAINNDATKVGKLINVHVLVKSTTSQCLQVPVLVLFHKVLMIMLYFLFKGNGKKMTKHFKKIISYRLKNGF